MNKSYNSKKFLQKKKRMQKIRIWAFCILILILIFSFFYFMRHPKILVDNIVIENNVFISSESLSVNISNIIDDYYFYLIPKSNVFFIPRKEIQTILKNENPALESLEIDVKGFRELNIKIKEYEPQILVSDIKDKKYFVNIEGLVFMEEPLIYSYKDLVVLNTDLENIEIRMQAVEPEFLGNLKNFINSLKNIDVIVVSIKNVEENIYNLKTQKGFSLRITSSDDLNVSFENLKTVLLNKVIDESDLTATDYIDLRFGNKVFYKINE
jgi:cell division septal protein FtsQ